MELVYEILPNLVVGPLKSLSQIYIFQPSLTRSHCIKIEYLISLVYYGL